MKLSISEAARRAGIQRQALYRKIKAGAISTVRSEDGQPQIDLSELARVFPAAIAATAQPVTASDITTDSLLQQEIKHLRERLDAAERDRDAWKDQARQLARLSPPAPTDPEQARVESRDPAPAQGWLGPVRKWFRQRAAARDQKIEAQAARARDVALAEEARIRAELAYITQTGRQPPRKSG